MPVLTFTAAAQTGFHSETYAAPGTTMMSAPFTPGGPPDLLFYGDTNAVMLNNGHGSFGPPQAIPVGTTQAAAVGDLNGDGKPDIAYCVAGTSGSYSVAAVINDGNGQFHESWTVPVTGICTGVAIGDENKDGHADIVVTSYVNNSGVNNNSVSTYPGDGSGDFFSTPITQNNINLDGTLYQGTSSPPDECNISDTVGAKFTGDKIPDLVVTADCPGGPINQGTLWLAKGTGNGHFTFSEITQNDFGYDFIYPQVVDANHDGRPDVSFVDYQEGPHGSMNTNSAILINQGNGVMAFHQTLTESSYAGDGTDVYAGSAADFNNDGQADSVVGLLNSSSSGPSTNDIALVEAQSGGGYSISQQWAITDTPRSIVAADFDNNGSPDIAVATQSSNGNPGSLIIYLNDSSTSTSCLAPSSPGAVLCTPQSGKTYASPVQVSGAGTAASGKVDHLELWVDGGKVANYPGNTVSTQISLANGSHSATLIEVDSSGNYLKSSPSPFTVGAGGGSCAPPSSPGAVLCAPTAGATVSSPVQFSGAGKAASGAVNHLELWIDGSKIGNYSGSSMTASVPVSSGSHSATLIEVDTSGKYLKSTPVSFTVGSGSGTCAPPSGTGARLCTPTPGSTVASPVHFSGAGSAGTGKVDHLELWIDGRKIGNYPGSTMTASVTLASGSHTATLVEVNTSYQATKGNPVTFTVH